MESYRDWSSLSSDMLVEIASRVSLFEDLQAFKGVCTSWQVAGSKHKFKPPRPSVPLLMLPKTGYDGDEQEFYSLSWRNTCMKLPLPETYGKRCMGVGFGWILTVGSREDVKLLNPFSRAQIDLPELKISQIHKSDFFLTIKILNRAVLSADPSETSNFVLMVIFGGWNLGFWRVGDKCWTDIELPGSSIGDITYHNEKFYAVGKYGAVVVWDPFGPDPTMADIVFYVPLDDMYLVESTYGELLLITIHDNRWDDIVARVMRLDTMKCVGERIAGLENDAVFVSKVNASISVDALAFPDFVKPNCIYFTQGDFFCWTRAIGGAERDIGVYCFEDRRVEWLPCSCEPLNMRYPPVWVAPSF